MAQTSGNVFPPQPGIGSVSGAANTVGNTVAVDVRDASNVAFHVKNTGSVTLAAGTFVFEASLDSTNGTDGTWFGVQVVRTNANTTETQIALSGITAGTGYATAWECSVSPYAWFRVRCSVAVTTNAIAFWTILRGNYATEPVPGIGSHAVTLSSTTLTSVTPAINADTTTTLGSGATYTGTSRDAAATAVKRTVAATFYADVASAVNGCLIDFSSDNTNWHPAASGSLSAGVPLQLSAILTARYWRVRMINGSGAQSSMRITSGMFAI